MLCDPAELIANEQIIVDEHLAAYGRSVLLNVMTTCVRSHLGVKRSAETIARMSAAQAGKKKPAEAVAKMAASLRGRRVDDATRAKISATHKAMPARPEKSLSALLEAQKSQARLDSLRAALVGKPKIHSAETKAKIAATLTGAKQSPDLIERRIAPLRGRKQSKEEIAKRVASRLANARAKKSLLQESLWP